MKVDRQVLAKWVRRVGFVLVLSWAIWQTSVASVERAQKEDLINVISRRSPITDYQSAENYHTDCRKNYEDAFLASVGLVITSERTDPLVPVANANIRQLTDVLAHIEQHCPTPIAPVFDKDGTLVAPPVLPSTTSSTSIPLPTTATTAPGG